MKKLNLKRQTFLNNINVSRHIYYHIIGEHHTKIHRIFVGSGIMLIGVCIAKSGASSFWLIHYITDIVGYLIHGIGAIPIIQRLEESNYEPTNKNK